MKTRPEIKERLEYLYHHLGRMGRDHSETIQEIRELENELIEKKILSIASIRDYQSNPTSFDLMMKALINI